MYLDSSAFNLLCRLLATTTLGCAALALILAVYGL